MPTKYISPISFRALVHVALLLPCLESPLNGFPASQVSSQNKPNQFHQNILRCGTIMWLRDCVLSSLLVTETVKLSHSVVIRNLLQNLRILKRKASIRYCAPESQESRCVPFPSDGSLKWTSAEVLPCFPSPGCLLGTVPLPCQSEGFE